MLPEGETTIPSSPGEPLHPCSQEVASRACRSRRCSTMLSGSNGQSGAADMMPAVLLRGFGLGFLFLSIMLIAFSKLPPASVAFGIGIFNIGRQLGGLLGVAALQTSIDDGMVHNQAALVAATHAGSPAPPHRHGGTHA